MPDAIDARLVEVAEAATAQINAAVEDGYFVGHQFTAKRSWASWKSELTGNTCLRVDVRGVRYDSSDLDDRDDIDYQCSIEIYVRQEFGEEHRGQDREIRTEVIDKLARLTEQLEELFIANTEVGDDITWRETRILSVADHDHLARGQYFGAVRVTLDAPRRLAA